MAAGNTGRRWRALAGTNAGSRGRRGSDLIIRVQVRRRTSRIGLEISATISGVGIVLLGVGIVAQLFALLTTPGELQDWMSRSYFGQLPDKTQPPNKFAKGDWKSENDALMAALKKEEVA